MVFFTSRLKSESVIFLLPRITASRPFYEKLPKLATVLEAETEISFIWFRIAVVWKGEVGVINGEVEIRNQKITREKPKFYVGTTVKFEAEA